MSPRCWVSLATALQSFPIFVDFLILVLLRETGASYIKIKNQPPLVAGSLATRLKPYWACIYPHSIVALQFLILNGWKNAFSLSLSNFSVPFSLFYNSEQILILILRTGYVAFEQLKFRHYFVILSYSQLSITCLSSCNLFWNKIG
jgi:hypothetical protein